MGHVIADTLCVMIEQFPQLACASFDGQVRFFQEL